MKFSLVSKLWMEAFSETPSFGLLRIFLVRVLYLRKFMPSYVVLKASNFSYFVITYFPNNSVSTITFSKSKSSVKLKVLASFSFFSTSLLFDLFKMGGLLLFICSLQQYPKYWILHSLSVYFFRLRLEKLLWYILCTSSRLAFNYTFEWLFLKSASQNDDKLISSDLKLAESKTIPLLMELFLDLKALGGLDVHF